MLVKVLLLMMFASSAVYAWEGHKWEDWKKVTTWEKPDLQTDQAGRQELVPLLKSAENKITSAKEWEKERQQIAKTIGGILGEPADLKISPPEVQVLGEQDLIDHIRRHIRIRSEPDDWIPAYLLIPKDLPKKPVPAMICLHHTDFTGKNVMCGLKGKPQWAFALQLVRRGYVCIVPDEIGFGERIPAGTQCYHDSISFYRRHRRWSYMGKMIWDVSRTIDYLETLPYVDRHKIGSVGLSHGSYSTIFAAAFEPRITAAIASCGFDTFRNDDQPHRWSHMTPLIPQLGSYLPEVKNIPFDWHHICALVAPRPLFICYSTDDFVFPNLKKMGAFFGDVQSVYQLYDAADNLAWYEHPGTHDFPDKGRAIAYRWLDDRFKFTPTSHSK